MKAIVQDKFGSADVLEFRDVEDPVVGEDDVLVQVRAAGCGPDVWHIMTGKPYFARLMPGFKKMNAAVRGSDVAGRVEAVGANVTDLRPGDEVMGEVKGSFAEFAIGTTETLVRKPANISFEQAAAVPVSGCTALQALRDVAAVQPGQTVLVIGAAGGVGTLAVQIAKAFGAKVTGVCSRPKADLVRSIGADDVIDYTQRGLHGREPPLGRHRRRGGASAAAAPPSRARAEGDAGDRGRRRRWPLDRRLLPPDPASAPAVPLHRSAHAPGHLEGEPSGPRDAARS